MRPYRSLFWPILLIGVGVVWLLGNLNLIPDVSLIGLLRLWPVLLIVAGLDLLFARSSAIIGGLIGLLAVAFVLVVLVAGQSLGLSSQPELIRETFSEPLGDASAAHITLDLEAAPTHLEAAVDSNDLIHADIDYFGAVQFEVSGSDVKRVRLSTSNDSLNWMYFTTAPRRDWRISLAPQIPLDLTIDSGSGSANLDLSGLTLSDFALDSGSGSIDLSLPAGDEAYQAMVDSGSGSVDIDVPCGAGITLQLDGGSGARNVNVAEDCPLRVEVRDGGSGAIRLPSTLERISGSGGEDEGVWESSDYSEALPHIFIRVLSQGSGSLTVR